MQLLKSVFSKTMLPEYTKSEVLWLYLYLLHGEIKLEGSQASDLSVRFSFT